LSVSFYLRELFAAEREEEQLSGAPNPEGSAPDACSEGDEEKKTWMKIGIPVGVLVLLAAWYAFRPERLVVNRYVDEAMPAAQGGPSPQPLESGRFYSILHPTGGNATI
jgi:hypothetical protein